jgi:hypothetical protein
MPSHHNKASANGQVAHLQMPNLTGTEMIDIRGRTFNDLFHYENCHIFGPQKKKIGVDPTISNVTEILFIF